MKKSKILISLVTIVLAVLVIGNVITLAAEPTQITSSGSSNTTTITPIGAVTNNTTNNTNSTDTNTNTNANANTNTNTNTNVSNNVVSGNVSIANTNSNTSSYVSNNTSKLPYAGTASSSIVILAIAFAASAIYAYKKVNDYNL